MHNIIFNKKVKITVLNKFNFESPKLKIEKDGVNPPYEIIIPKVEYELALKMKEILTQKQIDKLLPLIDNFEHFTFNAGMDEEGYNNFMNEREW